MANQVLGPLIGTYANYASIPAVFWLPGSMSSAEFVAYLNSNPYIVILADENYAGASTRYFVANMSDLDTQTSNGRVTGFSVWSWRVDASSLPVAPPPPVETDTETDAYESDVYETDVGEYKTLIIDLSKTNGLLLKATNQNTVLTAIVFFFVVFWVSVKFFGFLGGLLDMFLG